MHLRFFQKSLYLLLALSVFPILLLVLSFLKVKESIISPVAIQPNLEKVMSQKVIPSLSKTKNNFTLHHQSQFLVKKANASESTINARSYIVVDLQTGEILDEKNSDQKLPIASLTKIMTAVTALDLADPNDIFTITNAASRVIPTKLGVIPNEHMRLSELLEGMLMTSANDAAKVIQEGVDTQLGQPIFIKAMNEKAKFLGLTDSSFANPQGFDDPNNYSTVKDLSILSEYALKNYPLISEIVKKDYVFLPANSIHKQFDLYNWNGLIGVYPETIGMKIGNTDDAGKTTIVVSNRSGKKILAILLGAPDIVSRDLGAAQLLDNGYATTLNLPRINITRRQLQEKYNTWH